MIVSLATSQKIYKKKKKKNINLISDLKQEKKGKFKDHTCWPDTRPSTKYRNCQVCNQLKKSLSITKSGRVLHSSSTNTKFTDYCVSLKPALSFTSATSSQHSLLRIVLNVGNYYIDLFQFSLVQTPNQSAPSGSLFFERKN